MQEALAAVKGWVCSRSSQWGHVVRLLTVLLASAACTTSLANEGFVVGPRSAVGVFVTDEERQLVEWIGPDASRAPLPQLEPGKRIGLILRVVPDGMHLVRQVCERTDNDVTMVELCGVAVSDADIEFLVIQCPKLITVVLRSAATLNPDELADLDEAERRSLASSQLSPAALNQLSRLQNLEILNIRGYELPRECLQEFARVPNLHSLWLGNQSYKDDDLADLTRLPALRALSLIDCPVTAAGVGHLQKCEHLKRLKLESTAVGDDWPQSFAGQPPMKWTDVTISDSKMTANGIQQLKNALPFTKVMNAQCSLDSIRPVTDRNAQAIRLYRAAAYALQSISVSEVLIKEDVVDGVKVNRQKSQHCGWIVSHLEQFQELKGLDLAGARPTIEDLRRLRGLPELEVFTCKGAQFGDNELEEVCNLEKLHVLDIGQTQVTDEGMVHVQRLQNLQIIAIYDTDIGDRGMEFISKLPKLRRLSASNCLVTDDGARHLLDSDTLVQLQFTRNAVSKEMEEKLLEHLAENRKALQADDREPKTNTSGCE